MCSTFSFLITLRFLYKELCYSDICCSCFLPHQLLLKVKCCDFLSGYDQGGSMQGMEQRNFRQMDLLGPQPGMHFDGGMADHGMMQQQGQGVGLRRMADHAMHDPRTGGSYTVMNNPGGAPHDHMGAGATHAAGGNQGAQQHDPLAAWFDNDM